MVYAKSKPKAGSSYRSRQAKKPSTYALAKKAYTMVKKIDNNFEKKYIDTAYNSTVAGTLAPLISLNLIAEGDTSSQRTGNKIHVKSIRMNFQAFATGNTDDIAGIRIIVIKDKQTAGSTYPAAGTVLFDPTNITSNYNNQLYKDKIKVLYDKVVPLNSTGIAYNGATTVVYNPAKTWSKWLFPNTNVLFNGSANTNVEKNALWVYAMIEGSGSVTLNMSAQTCYTDN